MESKQDKKYTYEDLLEIIRILRSENGCKWDRAQTHQSLKPCIMEEAAELLAAIRIYDQTGNPENMREELGDILMLVVLHAQIASEEGLFTMADVVEEVSRKMVRRHPHVFGNGQADTTEQILATWDEIKKEEKKGKDWIESPLREIPKELPSLTRAAKVLKKVDKLYEKQKDYQESVEQLQKSASVLQNLEPATCSKELEQVMADMLVAMSDIARIYQISSEQVFADRIEEIIEKYEGTKD